MIDYVIGVVIIICMYFIYVGLSFFNFRRKLLKELKKTGMSYDEANDLYSIHSDLINKMHFEKKNVNIIVEEILSLSGK